MHHPHTASSPRPHCQETGERPPQTPADPLAHLLTFGEIDAARATLRRIVELREAEHQVDTNSRVDAAGNLAANRALHDTLDQLAVVRRFRAVPDELMQAYRELRVEGHDGPGAPQ